MDFLIDLTDQQVLNLTISAALILGILILGPVIVKLILDRGIRKLVVRTNTTIDDEILGSIRSPAYWLLVSIVLDYALSRLDFLPASFLSTMDDIFYVLYLWIGFVIIWRMVKILFTWYAHEMAVRTETNLDEQLTPFLLRIALMILGAIWVITILGHFEIDISAMVTTLGIGSLAIALAAQAALSDTISGFVIMIDRPFRIGDRIEIQALDTWGDVVDIGLRSSRIRTRDNRMVIVPNSVIVKSLVVNYSFPTTEYRIQIHIGVAYGSDIEIARNTIIDSVRGVEGVLPDKKVEALFLEFGDSAMIFRVRWWINSYVDTRRMFDKVNTTLYKALESAGIDLPFPQWDVNVKMIE